MAIPKHSSSASIPHEYPNKRSRLLSSQRNAEGSSAPQSKIDPTYGQRGAFPGLDDDNADGIFYGPAEDGLEYLRMVRSEARGVPTLLVASSHTPKSTEKKDDDNSPLNLGINNEEDPYKAYSGPHHQQQQSQGWYADGAYVAVSEAVPPQPTDGDSGIAAQEDAQEAYYTALLARFAQSRHRLLLRPPPLAPISAAAGVAAAEPPPQHVKDLSSTLLTYPSPRTWRRVIMRTAPAPLIVVDLPQETVMMGIEVLEDILQLESLRTAQGRRVGAWAWALLGKCRDVGQMDSEAVGVLRDLGKKAAALLRRIRAGECCREDDEEDSEDRTIGENEAGEMDINDDGGDDILDTGGDDVNSGDYDALPETESKGNGSMERANGEDDDNPDLAAAQQRLLSRLGGDGTTEEKETQFDIEAPKAASTEEINGANSRTINDVASHGDGSAKQDSGVSSIYATLDMIVTIIGECYGQRDLLDARLAWEEL